MEFAIEIIMCMQHKSACLVQELCPNNFMNNDGVNELSIILAF